MSGHHDLGVAPDRRVTDIAVSVITVAELRLGVLAAADGATRARRLDTLSRVEALDPLPVDKQVAHAWAAARLALRDAGKRMPLNDSGIAATAIANHIPVVSRDDDYGVFRGSRSSAFDPDRSSKPLGSQATQHGPTSADATGLSRGSDAP